jgi:hypothetical protein
MVRIEIKIVGQPIAPEDGALITAVSISLASRTNGRCEIRFRDADLRLMPPRTGQPLEVSLRPFGSADFVSFSGEIEDVRSRRGADDEFLVVQAVMIEGEDHPPEEPGTTRSTPIEVSRGGNALVWDLSFIVAQGEGKPAPPGGPDHRGSVTIVGDPAAVVGATCDVRIRSGISGLHRIEAAEHRWSVLGYETQLTLVRLPEMLERNGP